MSVNKDLTELVLVVDRSGSMMSCVADMEGGMKQLLDDQRQEDGRCNVTYVRFDQHVEEVLTAKDIKEVEDIKIEPRGSTALLDGLGTAINSVGNRLAKTPENERPGLIVVAVVTDGGENASKEYNSAKIREMVSHQTEKYGWQFTFLGANQDSFAVANKLSFDSSRVSNYSTDNSSEAMHSMSGLVRSMRGVAMKGGSAVDLAACSYSDADRQSMMGKKSELKSKSRSKV